MKEAHVRADVEPSGRRVLNDSICTSLAHGRGMFEQSHRCTCSDAANTLAWRGLLLFVIRNWKGWCKPERNSTTDYHDEGNRKRHRQHAIGSS